MQIIIALLVFGLIILIHEMGHFLLAKKNGIYVEEFSIGMGPRLFSFTRKETRYSIKLLPLGGSCMMLGEDDASEDDRAFGNKSVWARMAVIFAGPLFNFILAFILAIFLVQFSGIAPPVVSGFAEQSPAKEAGIQVGDTIKQINGSRMDSYKDISYYLQMHQNGKPITVTFVRDGQKQELSVTPEKTEDGMYLIGILGQKSKGTLPQVLKYSAIEVKTTIKTTVQSLAMLVTGKVKTDQMAGPVRIVGIIGDTYEQAKVDGTMTILLNLANISILLSANLGVMNLLPIPALDGGRLVFLIVEAIRGKKIPSDKEGFVHFVGFCALMVLMVLIFFNDIKNLFV